MTATVLLTLGRLPKGLDLARSFHQAGWRVIIADPARTHLAASSRAADRIYHVPPPATNKSGYLEALADIVRREAVDLVIPISEEVMYVAHLADDPALRDKLFCMPSTLIHQVHDKERFAGLCSTFGLTVPETARASGGTAIALAAKGPFITKPRHSCAGDQIRFYNAGDAFDQRDDQLVQQRIIGQEISSCTLARAGTVIATSLYRGTLMNGTVAVGFEHFEHQQIDEWISRFVAATAWTGFIAFDFMIDHDDVPYALECNPRLTSGVHFFKTADLANAITGSRPALGFRAEKRLMQFWSCMEEWQKSLGNWQRMTDVASTLWHHRDVTWSWRDPLPLIMMPWTARNIIRAARQAGLSFGIAATRDIVWTESAENVHDQANRSAPPPARHD